MPLLFPLLEAAFPTATEPGARILEAVAIARGEVAPAEAFALRLGYPNRHRLAREMAQAGLPPLEQLGGWARTLWWVVRDEAYAESLCGSAIASARYPSDCYRLVKRMTGRTWTEVRALGSEWVVAAIRERYGYGVVGDGGAVAAGETTRRRSA